MAIKTSDSSVGVGEQQRRRLSPNPNLLNKPHTTEPSSQINNQISSAPASSEHYANEALTFEHHTRGQSQSQCGMYRQLKPTQSPILILNMQSRLQDQECPAGLLQDLQGSSAS